MSEDGRLPYPGLRAYERDETDLFFGREGCVDEMVDRLAATRFLAVLGASGSGKSSLVRTGLLDALEIGLLAAAGPLWAIVDCHPGGSAFRNLADALLAATATAPASAEAIDTLEAFLRRGPRSIVEWVNDGHLPAGHNLLVLVDQFEELFRYADYAGREEAEAFAALLLESARSTGRIYVVITMRSEYLGACALIPGLAEQINSSLYLTRRMTREECREAIEGPAAVIGFTIEPDLVSRILNDLAMLAPWEQDRENSQLQRLSRQADQLPLMQHALSRLWQLARRRRQDTTPVLRLQDYLDIGMLQGALDQHAREVTNELSEAAKPVVRLVFRALITGNDLSEAVRKPMRLAELVRVVNANEALVREVVDGFRARDCNFLRPSGNQPLLEDTVVDISHESLIRQWSDLSKWFDEEASSSALWARLIYSEERHAAGQGELLSGLDLANALAWWDREQPTVGWASGHGGKFQEIGRYLNISKEAEEQHVRGEQERVRRERVRLRRTIFAISCFAVICLGLAGLSFGSYLMMQRANAAAQRALAEARAANETSMDAADMFVIGEAARLQQMRGMPYEEVTVRLRDGKAFLDKLAEHPVDMQRIELSRAKLQALNAEGSLIRGNVEQALKLASEADASLQHDVTEANLIPDRELISLKFGTTEMKSLIDLRRYDEAITTARQNLRLADAHPGSDPRSELERVKARLYMTLAYGYAKLYAKAHEYAGQCLDYVNRPTLATLVDRDDRAERDYYSARCSMDDGVFRFNLDPHGDFATYYRRAVDDFDAIPPDKKTVDMAMTESQALTNAAATYKDAKDPNEALQYYLKAERVVELSPVDLQQNVWLRQTLVIRANALGKEYDARNERDTAETWFRKAINVGLQDEKWQSLLQMADTVDTAMSNLENDLVDADWHKHPEALQEYMDIKQRHVPLREFLIRSGVAASWCDGCLLVDKQHELSALMDFDRYLRQDRFPDALKLGDQIIADATSVLGNSSSERATINARRAWYWTVHELAFDPKDMPSLAAIKDPTERATKEIARLTAVNERLSAFVKAFPDAWFVERDLGRADGILANLYASLGRKDDALNAAQAGAGLFDRTSVALLEQWYRTGSGPVARDQSKADGYRATLNSRRWDVTVLTAHHSKPLYQTDSSEIDHNIYIEDPRFPGDDPVARAIRQSEFFEGVELSDKVKKVLRDDLTAANEKKTSFSELVLEDIGSAVSSDELRSRITAFAFGNDVSGGARELAQQWRMKDGEQTVKDVVTAMLRDNSDRKSVAYFGDVAKQIDKNGTPTAAAAILDALLARPNLPPDEFVDFLEFRGNLRDAMGNRDGAMADWSLALPFDPNNAQVLNSLGYVWADSDKNVGLAVDLLTKAVKLDPNDANIRDSLGWAKVKAGQTEDGLKLLESAAAERPDVPDIVVHLADTYRRLGRDKEAATTFAQAESIARDPKLIAFIEVQKKLLGDNVSAESQPPQ